MQVCLLTCGGLGHHAAYLRLFTGLLEACGAGSMVTDSPGKAIGHAGPVLIMMVEEYPLLTYAIAALRSAGGRRTVGLLFRAREAIRGKSARLRLKRALLRLTRLQPRTAILTIVPHDILGEAAALSKGWIDDPQLWDLDHLHPEAGSTPLAEWVQRFANGRPVILCLGLLTPEKGLETLAAMAADPAFTERYCLVLAGRVERSSDVEAIAANEACLIENRYITDDELLSLYRVAQFVWAAYAPGYNQASGVFGRAVQLGCTPIVRRDSLIDRYARRLAVSAVSIPWRAKVDEIGGLLETHQDVRPDDLETRNRSRAQRNATFLIETLFGEVPSV